MQFAICTFVCTFLWCVEGRQDSYVPQRVECPANFSYVREARDISPGEEAYLAKRDALTLPALMDWLDNSDLEGFDPYDFLSNSSVRIGVACSGGGYRAMLSGAGQLAALDNRTRGSTESGHLGGLLQATTYISSSSGGSWLVGSMALNNFASVEDLQFDETIWNFQNSLLSPGGSDLLQNLEAWVEIAEDVLSKRNAGFPVSLTDPWGRALGYQLLDASDGGIGLTFSSLRDSLLFQEAQMPFPIVIADSRGIGDLGIYLNSTVFEINPFEIGSWDPDTYHFADLKYLGSEDTSCISGYDNAGFIMGTSSSLFNQFLLELDNSTDARGPLVEAALESLSDSESDVSLISPNPFYDIDTVIDSEYDLLTLVDGGLDGMNIPFYPLYQPYREVDLIVAFDNSGNTADNWPDGQAMIATYERQFESQSNGVHFPDVPSVEEFQSGLIGQPAFFGCNIANYSLSEGSPQLDPEDMPPVVVYMANSEHSYPSNIGTFKLEVRNDERDAMIQNGYNTMTQNNGTLDSEWRSALGCAIVLRETQRRGQSLTPQCERLLQNYCWDQNMSLTRMRQTTGPPIRRDGKLNTDGILN